MSSSHLFIERFVTILILATGLSHAVQPRLWAELFRDLLPRPYAAFYIGVFTLPVGLLIVLLHNVWVADWAVIVTIMGWCWTTKSCLYLLIPKILNRFRNKAAGPRAERNLVIIGLIMAALGGVMVWRFFLIPVTA
jgi:uncharacterized protein YjeT (DUF2065 family)